MQERTERVVPNASGTTLERMNALRLEKKRILKVDGRYLLFYHSAATASVEQREAFAEVAAEAIAVTATTTARSGAQTGAGKTGAAGRERADV